MAELHSAGDGPHGRSSIRPKPLPPGFHLLRPRCASPRIGPLKILLKSLRREEMRRTILLLTGLMLFAGVVRGQETPSAELSASYSAFRLNGLDGFTLNGGSLSLAGNVNHWFGVAGDFGAYHRQLSYTGAANLQTYLFG